MKKKKSRFSNKLKKRQRTSIQKNLKNTLGRRAVTYRREEEDFDNLLYKYEVENVFSKKVMENVEIFDSLDFSTTMSRRQDLSAEFIITIDGEDAKDFDDAVSLVYDREKQCYRLGVHIADVSFFVGKGSPLDKEALRRGNSIYLINRVVPMLPERLSNDLCSLVQGQKRLCLSCQMVIDTKGEIVDYTFFKSFIESRRRATYGEVEDVLQGRLDLGEEFKAKMALFSELRTILYQKRIREGSIDLDSDELFFSMTPEDRVASVSIKRRRSSEQIIEEFMLSANRCAAHYLKKMGLGIYRIHESPKEEKMQIFRDFVLRKGLSLPKTGMENPLLKKGKNRYQIFLESIKDEKLKRIYSYQLLTSFNQARYSEKNVGHYGLAFRLYTHFTSPIRRYPDLVVHRLISAHLQGRWTHYDKDELHQVALGSSLSERKAVVMEREYRKIKSIRYMQDKIGDVFHCIVVGVMENGLFLKEKDTGIEGFHSFYWNTYPYENPRGKGKAYDVGSEVVAKLTRVDLKKLFIDFEIQEGEDASD